jgi:hypothetical protein
MLDVFYKIAIENSCLPCLVVCEDTDNGQEKFHFKVVYSANPVKIPKFAGNKMINSDLGRF